MAEVCVTAGLTVLVTDTLDLRVTGVIATICALVVAPRVVDIPEEAFQNLKSSLTNKLVALPDSLRGILIHQCQWVVVL